MDPTAPVFVHLVLNLKYGFRYSNALSLLAAYCDFRMCSCRYRTPLWFPMILFSDPLFSLFILSDPLTTGRPNQAVKRGHRCSASSYLAVLNSTSWVIVKFSQLSEQAVIWRWAPVSWGTSLCICICNQNNLPLGSWCHPVSGSIF